MKTMHPALGAAMMLGLALTGCGGGGADGPGAAQTQAAVASLDLGLPQASASAAGAALGAAVTLDASASSDPKGQPLSYRWTIAAAPAGSAAQLSGATEARATLIPDLPGDYALSLVVSDGQRQSLPATASFRVPLPEIVTEPGGVLSGRARLSLSGPLTGAVSWYADQTLIGEGESLAGRPIEWDTTAAGNGDHQLVARIRTGENRYQEVRRQVTVNNAEFSLSASVSGQSGSINVDVRVLSSSRVVSVDASLDGAAATTLNAPNACARLCASGNDLYRFSVDASKAGSGPHEMAVTATDSRGVKRQINVAVPVSNAAAIRLSQPALDGVIVYGKLQVSGNTTSDKAGPITVSASLGELQIFSTTAATFSGSLDLGGIAPGSQTLTVRVLDSAQQPSEVQRSVVVASSPALTYAPAFQLPSGGRLLTSDGNRIVYLGANAAAFLRDLASGTEVGLDQSALIQYATGWQLSGGRVYAHGQGPDCINSCVYQWSAEGQLKNLSRGNPYASSSSWSNDQNPIARGDWVVWGSDASAPGGLYIAHRISSGSYAKVGRPEGASALGSRGYDAAEVDGALRLHYWAQTGGNAAAPSFDVFEWRSDTGASTRLTQIGLRSTPLQTDGKRVAWLQSPVGASADSGSPLVTQALAGGARTTVVSEALDFRLRDGVLAWSESSAGGRTLKAATETTTLTLSAASDATLQDGSGGQFVYTQQGKLWSWSFASGSTLRLDAVPRTVFFGNTRLVFPIGSTVYRVAW